MSLPLVTVLTAVRNGSRYLAETVASIRNQSFQDWEHVIVDDASDDDTPELLESLSKQDARIRVVRREVRGGQYAAANDGLRVAKGRYIAVNDADDVSTGDRLETQLEFLRLHPELKACASYWGVFSDDVSEVLAHHNIDGPPRVWKWKLLVQSGPAHSSLFIRRDALDRLGGYRERLVSQDFKLWCDLSLRDWLGVVPKELVLHRRHSGQISARANSNQVEASQEAAREHAVNLCGPDHGLEQAIKLRGARLEPPGLIWGLRAVGAWERRWKEDPGLTEGDQKVLAALSRQLRISVVWAGVKKTPAATPLRAARRAAFATRSWMREARR